MDKKNKSERVSIEIIKYIPMIIVGLSYVAVGGAKFVQILMSNHFNLYLFVLETLWVLLGIAILYQKKAAIIFSLVSYPLVFAVENPPISINLIGNINFITPFFYTPFHHIFFIIFQKYGLLSIVKPYRIFYLWGIYTIHLACLFPYLFKPAFVLTFPERIHKLKPAVRFPEEVFMYEKNAFQVLGLIPCKANKLRAILKRKKDLSNLIKVGLNPQTHIKENYHVIPWPKAKPISKFTIDNAYSFLENTLRRVKEELFWFYLEENNMEAFECLEKGDFEEAKSLWDDEAGDNPKTYKAALALHNLAVLEHALILNEERATIGNLGVNSEQEHSLFILAPFGASVIRATMLKLAQAIVHNLGKISPKMLKKVSNFSWDKPRMLPPEQINKWKGVLALWMKVYKHDKCWDYFRERMLYLNDPRINDDYLCRLRRDMPGMVLNVNLKIASTALSQEMFEYAKQHLDLIRSSGFNPNDVNRIMEEFFAPFIKELKAIGQTIERLANHIEEDKLCREYTRALEKAIKVKNRVDRLEGCPYIEEEIKKITSIPNKRIRKDLNSVVGKIITIRDEISNYANFLIKKWNNELGPSLNLQTLYLAKAIKEKFEENARRISELKVAVSEGLDIIDENKKILKKTEKLCCSDECIRNIKSDIK